MQNSRETCIPGWETGWGSEKEERGTRSSQSFLLIEMSCNQWMLDFEVQINEPEAFD